MLRARALMTIAGSIVLIAACGGGGTGGTTAAPAGTVGGGGTAASAPAEPAPSTAAEASVPAAASEPATGNGSGAGVCELATTDELAGDFGVAGVVTEAVIGPPDTCVVSSSDGTPLASWVLTEGGGRAVYDALALPNQATDVPGLGDKAAIVENTGLLIVKGDRLVTIVVGAGADVTPEEAVQLMQTIGGHIAGRL